MFSITVTCPSTAELLKVAKVLDDAGVTVGAIETNATESTTPAKATTKAASSPKAKAESKPAEEKAPAKAKEPSEADKAKLYAPVKEIALKLSKDKGRDVLLRTLQAFDVEKAPDLAVDQYDAFIEAAQAELDT